MTLWETTALVAVLWLGLGLLAQAGALRAQRLGGVAPPPCFRAAPVATDPVRLAFLGDLQRGVASTARALPEALREAGSTLLISSGDFVSHGEAPYYGVLAQAFRRAGIAQPVRVVPGNHDLYPRRSKDESIGGREFQRCFGERTWALSLGPLLLVGLDTGGNHHFARQAPWLRATLAAHPHAPWICVSHRPPYLFDRPGAPAARDMGELLQILQARPPLLHVSGHLHAYVDQRVEGIRYIVNAHGGDLHGYDPGLGGFDLLHVEVDAGGRLAHVERRTYARRRDPRTYLDQLCVRLWDERRRLPWALLAAPAGWLLRPLGLYVPVVRYPEQRAYPQAPAEPAPVEPN